MIKQILSHRTAGGTKVFRTSGGDQTHTALLTHLAHRVRDAVGGISRDSSDDENADREQSEAAVEFESKRGSESCSPIFTNDSRATNDCEEHERGHRARTDREHPEERMIRLRCNFNDCRRKRGTCSDAKTCAARSFKRRRNIGAR